MLCFPFSSHMLNSLDDLSLKSCCNNLENVLMNCDKCHIHGYDNMELKILQKFLPKEKLGALDILKFLRRVDSF